MPHALMTWVAVVAALDGGADPAAAVRAQWGLHPDLMKMTARLSHRTAQTPAQRGAEKLLSGGGTYAVGALSLALARGDEASMLAAVRGEQGTDEPTEAATRVFIELLRQFPAQRARVVKSPFERDRLLALAATPQSERAPLSARLSLPERYAATVSALGGGLDGDAGPPP